MNTAWDRSLDQTPTWGAGRLVLAVQASGDHREHLMQTNGVAFYRCGACGHMFIVRMTPREPEPDSTP